MRKTHKAYKVKTGYSEWGPTYTVYVWDDSQGIYRELVTNYHYRQACRVVKESNK